MQGIGYVDDRIEELKRQKLLGRPLRRKSRGTEVGGIIIGAKNQEVPAEATTMMIILGRVRTTKEMKFLLFSQFY